MTSRATRGRRVLGKIRRRAAAAQANPASGGEGFAGQDPSPPPEPPHPGWDHTSQPQDTRALARRDELSAPLRPSILSLLSDPRIDTITADGAARALDRPRQDVDNAIAAMVQAGELLEHGSSNPKYGLPAASKHRLEEMFRDAAHELGEPAALIQPADDMLPLIDDDTEEPRLPVTAGLLSLFLPGTGQLLNGDVGRASLVFAVWSLAWITHLSPVWTFVCLYAGAEAFFTAKIRSMERKMAKEALTAGGPTPHQLPPKPSST